MQNYNFKQKIISFSLVFFFSIITFISPVLAQGQTLEIYFFYSETCPHCVAQKPLMEYIDVNNQDIILKAYEVHKNQEIWQEFLSKYQINSAAVPRTLIGETSFIGYSETDGELEYNAVYQGYIGYKNQIIQAIEKELNHPINIPGSTPENTPIPWWLFFLPIAYFSTYPLLRKKLNSDNKKRYWIGIGIAVFIVSCFLFLAIIPEASIKLLAQSLPFPLFVSTIAIADGFNPCAFTVLIILLSLLTYTKSRKDMAIMGLTFVITSAIMYFTFIMMMITIGSIFLEKYGTITMLILGCIITIAGGINLKDYFVLNQGISLSLSQEQKIIFSKKAGKIAQTLKAGETNYKILLAALGGTILLAIFVNIVELGCTAILPVVYLTSLIQYCGENSWVCFSFWTGIYALIYIIPLFAILGNFIYSFKSSRLTEKQGRILKLMGGSLMVFFGLIMIFKPELLLLFG